MTVQKQGIDFVEIADVATNTKPSHVIGNKSDAAVTAVGIVASIIAYVKGLLNQIAAIKAITDLVIPPVTAAENTVTANWNTAAGTSGEAGEDLVSFGADATKNKVGCLKLDVSACTDGAVLTVKLFEKINGTERKTYSQSFVVNTDPDGLRIITSDMVITDVMRCEVYSNTSESVAIAYEVA